MLSTLPNNQYDQLRTSIYESILELATEDGINASGKNDVYGCIFGRDSAVTILKLLKVCNNPAAGSYFNTDLLQNICRRALINLTLLQGKESNIESGEQPGKFIHEYRKDNYERLTNRPQPWYVYPDGILRNYDSIDSTPLCLIALYRYWEITKDNKFLLQVLPAVEAGLNWIITYGDMDKDFLLEYELSPHRKHGGLLVQSWTDSRESLTNTDGKMPDYPIAPVEVQGYAWLALKLWADYYSDSSVQYAHTKQFGRKLNIHAQQLKERFNTMFLDKKNGSVFPVQALDGHKRQIKTVTGNPLLLLWATYTKNTHTESILEEKHIPSLVKRAFNTDLFDEDGGIRTMSTTSPTYNSTQNSYHNGSFWPKLNGMSHEGLVHWKYKNEAKKLKIASLKAIEYFGSAIELYIKTDEGKFLTYKNLRGQESCKQQAWSAAATLDWLSSE